MTKIREHLAVRNLKDIKDIFERFGIEYWLDSGTLLGAVRDRRLLSWDRDVDLGTLSVNVSRILCALPEFKRKRFNVYSQKYFFKFERYGIPIDLSINYIKGDYAGIVWVKPLSFLSKMLKVITNALSCKVYIRPKKEEILCLMKCMLSFKGDLHARAKLFRDLFTYFFSFLPPSLNEFLYNLSFSLMKRCRVKLLPVLVPRHYYEELECIEFYGMKFKIPSEVYSYLEYRYGKDWRIPVKDWDPYKDDRAAVRC